MRIQSPSPRSAELSHVPCITQQYPPKVIIWLYLVHVIMIANNTYSCNIFEGYCGGFGVIFFVVFLASNYRDPPPPPTERKRCKGDFDDKYFVCVQGISTVDERSLNKERFMSLVSSHINKLIIKITPCIQKT